MEQPRGRKEAERRARMEGSGSSKPKPQGTKKTRRTGTRRKAEERARKTTQCPGQSRKNGLGRRYGKQKSWTPPQKRDRAITVRQPPQEPEGYKQVPKKEKQRGATRGTMAPKTDTAANKEQPPEVRGLKQGKADREREGQRRTKRTRNLECRSEASR